MDRETWNFINGFSNWLSAFGTIAAVVVSLYLAMRDWRIRLRVEAGIREIIPMGQRLNEGKQYVGITVTNKGRRSAKINNLFWNTGIFRKHLTLQIPPDNPFSAKLPVRLGDGDEAAYYFPLATFKEEIREFKKHGSFKYPRLEARFIRVGVSTSTGEEFKTKVEKPLRHWLAEQLTTATDDK